MPSETTDATLNRMRRELGLPAIDELIENAEEQFREYEVESVFVCVDAYKAKGIPEIEDVIRQFASDSNPTWDVTFRPKELPTACARMRMRFELDEGVDVSEGTFGQFVTAMRARGWHVREHRVSPMPDILYAEMMDDSNFHDW